VRPRLLALLYGRFSGLARFPYLAYGAYRATVICGNRGGRAGGGPAGLG